MTGNESVKIKIRALAAKSPEHIDKTIRTEGINIVILATKRKVPAGVFHWGQIHQPETDLGAVSKIPNLMGKTLCAGELPLSKDGLTIVVAADAPKSTLLHEYLHVLQIEKDQAWCPLSKKMWGKRKLSAKEISAAQDKEWDVHRFLWEEKDELALGFEDKLGIAANLQEQAVARSKRDPEAMAYLEKEKVGAYLRAQIEAYQANLRDAASKKPQGSKNN